MIWAQLVGFVFGLLASVVGWWAIALWLTPRLDVSSLNRIPQDVALHPSGYRYRIKLVNRSKRFAVGDLSLQARLVIRGLDVNRPTVQTSIYLPVGMEPSFPVLNSRSKGTPPEEWERVYTIDYFKMRGNGVNRLPHQVLAGIKDRTIILSELLKTFPGSFIRFAVSGSHGRSGFRRTYPSKFYVDDITEGEFELGSIKPTKADDLPSS